LFALALFSHDFEANRLDKCVEIGDDSVIEAVKLRSLKAAAEAQQQPEVEGRKKFGRPASPPSTTPDPKRRQIRDAASRAEQDDEIDALAATRWQMRREE
jgi:hypothetical protein